MSDFVPSTKWRMVTSAWVLLFCVFLIGISSSVAVLVYMMLRPHQTIEGLSAPAEQTFTLNNPGFHIIYFSFQRTQDHRGIIRPNGFEQIKFSVSDPEGKAVELEAVSSDYDYFWRYTYEAAAYGFTAQTPGTYQLFSELPAGATAEPVAIVVEQVYKNKLRDAFLAELMLLLLTAALAAAVIQYGRRQYQKSDEAAYYNSLRADAA